MKYSAVALIDLNRNEIALIHKLKPSWQLNKANLIGGKVEVQDRIDAVRRYHIPLSSWEEDGAFLRCAQRELAEEAGVDVAYRDLKLVCVLHFTTSDGERGECRFFAARVDFDLVTPQTMESERVFVCDIESALVGVVHHETYKSLPDSEGQYTFSNVQTKDHPFLGDLSAIPTMINLPWLIAASVQMLKHPTSDVFPMTIYERKTAQIYWQPSFNDELVAAMVGRW